MDLTKVSLLSGLVARMGFLSARSTVIAQNIANADTPNYAAKDLEAPDFRASVARASSGLKVSDARHLPAPAAAAQTAGRVVSAPDGEASISGNQVSLETQAMKLSQTRQDYTLAATVYRKGLSMLRLAARGQ